MKFRIWICHGFKHHSRELIGGGNIPLSEPEVNQYSFILLSSRFVASIINDFFGYINRDQIKAAYFEVYSSDTNQFKARSLDVKDSFLVFRVGNR